MPIPIPTAVRARAEGACLGPRQDRGDRRGIARFTAPSLIFERNGCRAVAGGFQPVEAYDVLVSNLDPAIERRGGRRVRVGLGDDAVWLDPAHAGTLRSVLDAALSSSELQAVGF